MGKTNPFPKSIYVTYEQDDEPWFSVHEKGLPDDHGGDLVATYQLVKVERIKVTVEAIKP